MTSETGASTSQKQGVINKCPSCGGVLKAFASTCELCGHELSGIAANRTISELVARFDEIEAEVSRAGLQGAARDKEVIARKGRVIRDFAIPNSREDLQSLIFFIHPKIQDNIKPDPNADDWRVKFKEVMTLAKNAYRGDAKTRAEFEEIEGSLNTTVSGALQTRAKRYPLVAAGVALVVVLAAVGLGYAQYEKWQLAQCEEKYVRDSAAEKTRLNGIVATIDARRAEKRYTEAGSLLTELKWNTQLSCKNGNANQDATFWDDKRKELLAAIQADDAADNAQKAEAERVEQAKRQEEANRELAEKRAVADREAARQNARTDRDLEDSLSSRAKAAARKSW